jgi:predicted RNA binding protein YcfA (HicA-like mRNA interferase family)
VVRVRGSHHIMESPDGRRTTVPVHKNDGLPPGTLRSILKDVDLTEAQLKDLM